MVFKKTIVLWKLFISCFLFSGKWTRHEALYLLLVPFFGRLFSWQYFTPSQLSTGLVRWLAFKILHAFINLRVCLNFNPCLDSHQFGSPYKCYIAWYFVYYKSLLLARIILIHLCFYVWPSGRNLHLVLLLNLHL